LTGTVNGPAVTLSAATMSLGGQVVGTTSSAHTVTLTNSGNAALSITSMAITNGFAQANTCGASIAAGASCTITVTFTPSVAGEITGTLSVTDNAFGSPQQLSLSGTGQDFSIGFSRTTETVIAGQTARYDLLMRPLGGFSQTVALSCSGAPQFGDCAVSPASITPANGPVWVSLKVSTRAPSETLGSSAVGRRLPPGGPPLGPTRGLWLLALSAAIFVLAARRRRLALATALILLSVMMWVACGSETALFITSMPGTPTGTFTITVTATSGNLTHSATTILVVR
jgi:Abnormal spindle-like microcephaly-assoc'd, ASPM-SPD-2-Hydin